MDAILPLVFLAIMGLSLVLYVILDGYDLGIGLLLPLASDKEKDTMIAAIGPFWDANETWLVLGVGVLLIAFPAAHALVLTSLYIPVTIIGLLLARSLTTGARASGVTSAMDATTPKSEQSMAVGGERRRRT